MDQYVIKVSNIRKKFKTYKSSLSNKGLLSSIIRHYYDKKALDGLGMEIKRGEITALLGANGSGKSTLIKIMTGVLYPDSGEVTVNGLVPWKDRIKLSSQMGVVFSQQSNLYYDLPPVDTFNYMRHLYGIPEKTFNQRLDYLVKILELKNVYTRQTRLLSFGERMKCNFVTAVLHNPSVVFLDEATVGIDLPSRFALRRALIDMKKRFGTTFIIATHIVDDIEALAERIIFLDRGKIIFDGSKEKFNKILGDVRHVELHFKGDITIRPSDYGKVLEHEANYMKLEINANKIKSKFISDLLLSKQLLDYSVYEPDLGYILKKFYEAVEKRHRRRR